MNNLSKVFKFIVVIGIILGSSVFVYRAKFIDSGLVPGSNLSNPSVNVSKKTIITPDQARNFLMDLDVPTRDYLNIGAPNSYGNYEADSDTIILESKTGERNVNNISYSVFGDKSEAKAVELDIAVNDLSFSSNSIKELIKYSNELMQKVTGKGLTPEMKKAIQAKTNEQWEINGYKVKLEKEIFPDEEPVAGEESTSDHGAFSMKFLIEL